MSVITRSEAMWKLKEIANQINRAAGEVRDGNLTAAAENAADALSQLEAIVGHLDEASQQSPVTTVKRPASYMVPPPVGSLVFGRPPAENVRPPSPIKQKVNAPPPLKAKTPPAQPPAAPKPRVIIPPAPEPPPPPPPVFEPARVSVFPVEYDDVPVTTFDFARMLDISDHDPEVVAMQLLFNELPDPVRQDLIAQYQKTKKPVNCKIRTEGKQ